MKLVGRNQEISRLKAVLSLHRNLLIEGPVGVGKTFLVQEILHTLKRKFERIDGDTRFTEQKLTGWFDPPLVLKKGYDAKCFIDGPLVTAMKAGKVLFINELNRMPESVQNILLPAMDEKQIYIPKLGEIHAKTGFCVVATQNPKEFTATHSLSEALLDRFEMLKMEYQSEEEESEILRDHLEKKNEELVDRAITLVRGTRNHPGIKRGASIRAAIAICELVEQGMEFDEAALLSLPTRIELISSEQDPLKLIEDLLVEAVDSSPSQKKKPLNFPTL